MRRTKIVATLGPATDKPGVLERLMKLGVDILRINYSHQEQADHARRISEVRAAAAAAKTEVAVMADLQGPRIRLRRFAGGHVVLKKNTTFILDTELDETAGDETRVGISYAKLAAELHTGNLLLIDDGRVALKVTRITGHEIHCRVVRGGELSGHKGVNIPGCRLSLGALTSKDRSDLHHAVKAGVDYFAISFVKNAADLKEARRLVRAAGSEASMIAKFERAEALDNAEEIIEASDAIMIARGDLGVEIGDAGLPAVQKHLIRTACAMDRAVITATQMMQSMIEQQVPLRAEVFDVANAVLDGTDAIMLSAETSIGRFPEMAAEAADRVCREIEKQRSTRVSDHRINQRFEAIDESIAMAAMYVANHLGAKVIAAITETGSTCLWMSRISSGQPIFAFTRHVATERKVRLYRGVYPLSFDLREFDLNHIYRRVMDELQEKHIVAKGDLIIITHGDLRGQRGGTNTMKLFRIGDPDFSAAAGHDDVSAIPVQ